MPLPVASGSGSPKSMVGLGKDWPENPGKAASRCQIGVLGHVDNHNVRCAIQEQPIPMSANVGAGLVERVIVKREVRDHTGTVG